MVLNSIEVMKLERLVGDRTGETVWTDNQVVRRAHLDMMTRLSEIQITSSMNTIHGVRRPCPILSRLIGKQPPLTARQSTDWE
jgi:hypothetical protein